MLQTAFGASCMNRAWVFEWHKRFKEGRESLRDNERCGRSKEVRTPELIGQIKNYMDKDRRVSIETITAQFDFSVGTVHNYWRGTEDAEDLLQVCPKGAQRRSERKMLSWQQGDGRADQFRSRSSCSGDLWKKTGSTAMIQRPRDRVPSGSMLALPDPRRPDNANPLTKFWWSFFFTALAWSTCTGFPLDRQSTRNTMMSLSSYNASTDFPDSLSIRSYHPSLPTGLPKYILCIRRAVVGKLLPFLV